MNRKSDMPRWITFKDSAEWHDWLVKNHQKEKGVNLQQAVTEAICFGWIDGTLKSLDENYYALRFSHRKTGSVWSKINQQRAEELIQAGRMTEAGMKVILEAKKSGQWYKAYSTKEIPAIPDDLSTELLKHSTSLKMFNQLPDNHKLQYIMWINQSKKPKTRATRIKKVADMIQTIRE